MKIIRKWVSREYGLHGETIKVKLKALLKSEAAEFVIGMQDVTKGLPSTKEEAETMGAEGLRDSYSRYETPFVQDTFARFVKPDEPLEDEEGQPIDTGAKLLAVASIGFTQAVLMDLQRLCVNSETEGKASASPSTLPPAPAGNTASPAGSTEGEACQPPSTATAPSGNGLSSPVV